LGMAFMLTQLANVALSELDYAKATALLEESLRLYRDAGDNRSMAMCLALLGYTAILRGDPERATRLIEEATTRLREAELMVEASYSLTLALAATLRGEHKRATELIAEGIAVGRELQNNLDTVQGVEVMAMLAASQGKAKRAARLWAAAETARETMGMLALSADDRTLYEPYMVAVQAELGEEVWTEALTEGREMTLERAVGYGLSEAETTTPSSHGQERPSVGSQWSALTRREEEVAVLVARGMTNRKIASDLTISEHTAATHVTKILKKLRTNSRSQLAAWVTEQELTSSEPS
jgi:DNA-binding CsgD family transcriptional regulator